MNVLEWQYYLKDRISRIDKERLIDVREVKQAMSTVFNQFLSEAVKADSHVLYDYYAKEYSDIAVTLNNDTLRYEAEYPIGPILLPGKKLQKSLRFVNTEAGDDLDFVPITEEDYYYMKGQDVDLVDDTIRYYATKSKIVFLSGVDEDSELLVTGLRIKLLPQIEDYEATEQLHIPDSRDSEFVNLCLQYMGITPPTDLKDD